MFKQVGKPIAILSGHLSCLLVFTLFHSANSQTSMTTGTVYYSYRQDVINLKRDYVLKFSSKSSVYVCRQEASSYTTPQGYQLSTKRSFSDWYIDFKAKEITKRVILKDGTSLYSIYQATPIQWELQNETKVLLGHNVQKAVAKSHPLRSRETQYDYGDAIAWFATDIPISSGPDEYWGLPGLILELRFSIAFYFIAEKVVFEPQKDFRPNQGIKVTYEEIEKPDKIDNKKLKKARQLLNDD